MRLIQIENISTGDVLEQNVFRHDSLLALPKGTLIKDKEKEYLMDLKINEFYVSKYSKGREYHNEETLEIIRDSLMSCTLWDMKDGGKIYDGIRKKIKREKKILDIFSMLRKVDHYSFVSSVNIAIVVAKMMMLKNKVDNDLIELTYFSLIHDIGKIRVSKITTKEGELSEREFQAVRKHPIFSYKLLQKFGYKKNKIQFVIQTHEKYDGTGYPIGISSNEIQPLAQIIGIAELYNALSSFRPYRPAFHPIEVKNKIEMEENRAFGKEYIDLFSKKYTPYRVGVRVELNNGMQGEILSINDKVPMFPVVGVLSDEEDAPIKKINLFRKQDLRIARVLI